MQFKNALIGAIVGGLIGIGVLVAAFMFFGTQHTALALVVAVLVGVGVRMMVATKGHTSYMRGALTALVAILAFVGGNILVAKVAQSQIVANAAAPRQTAAPAPVADAEAEESPAVAVEPAEAAVETRPTMAAPARGVRGSLKSAYTTWDVIWLSVAMLVAYEFGRGSGTGPTIVPPPAETA
jgi:hypothetical protein